MKNCGPYLEDLIVWGTGGIAPTFLAPTMSHALFSFLGRASTNLHQLIFTCNFHTYLIPDLAFLTKLLPELEPAHIYS
jgi:hypothetical protein